MSKLKKSETPVAAATTCSGRVEISHREIATTGGCCAGMQSVILSIAASKGCPVDGIIAPKYHPDYDYRVTHHAEGHMTIEWKIRSQNDESIHPEPKP
jgi:hypothetical protein